MKNIYKTLTDETAETTNRPRTTAFEPAPMRGHNNYDTRAASHEATAGVKTDEVSLTVQSQAEDADLNVIMRRYGLTGKMPENVRIPTYGDFTGIGDYRSAFDAVREAERSFMTIPANVRMKFRNSPQEFLEFCSDEGNREEMMKLGLMKQAPIPKEPEKKVEPPKGGTT